MLSQKYMYKTWMNYCACWNYDSIFQWFCFQFQLVFSCMDQRYCALTTNLTAEINFPSIIVLFCSVYASKMTPQHMDSMLFKFISEAYTLQNNTTIYGQVISSGELFIKAQYLCSMQENTNWYWKQKPLQQTIIVPTRTILHPRLDVIKIIYVQGIPKNVCNRIQAKKFHTKKSY